MKSDVVIIGGGLAGLATGALLAREGMRTVVLERGNQPGGRACTYSDKGFTLNYGPHAMFRPGSGFLGDVLRRLDRPSLPYNVPDAMKSYWSLGDRFASLGAKPHQLLATKLFSVPGRMRIASMMLALRSEKPDRLGNMTYGEWVDQHTSDPLVRQFVMALGVVNSYTRPASQLSARWLISHLQRNLFAKDYVGYMSGGWGAICQAFVDELRANGGELVTAAHVDRLEIDGDCAVAALAGTRRFEADAFVSTLPPDDAPALAQQGSPLAAELSRWSGMRDVRAVCIDLGFDRRLRTDLTFVFDTEHDLYYSLHSEVTPDLAPEGQQLLHAMAYLSPDEAADETLRAAREHQLVDGLDRHFAGWRSAAVVQRTLPAARVSSARWIPGQMEDARVPLRSAVARNLCFAGEGRDLPYTLAETVLASAMQASDAIVADRAAGALCVKEAVPTA
ncbi:MAG: FAD-dependent oxidoreductase [Dehalococcoidia bacterium]